MRVRIQSGNRDNTEDIYLNISVKWKQCGSVTESSMSEGMYSVCVEVSERMLEQRCNMYNMWTSCQSLLLPSRKSEPQFATALPRCNTSNLINWIQDNLLKRTKMLWFFAYHSYWKSGKYFDNRPFLKFSYLNIQIWIFMHFPLVYIKMVL